VTRAYLLRTVGLCDGRPMANCRPVSCWSKSNALSSALGIRVPDHVTLTIMTTSTVGESPVYPLTNTVLWWDGTWLYCLCMLTVSLFPVTKWRSFWGKRVFYYLFYSIHSFILPTPSSRPFTCVLLKISGFQGGTVLMWILFLSDASVCIPDTSPGDVLTVSSENGISETSETARVFELVPSRHRIRIH
jgi:hypothetical protein